MNLAVLLYLHDENPNSVPLRWPSKVVEIGESTTLPDSNWLLMTVAQLEDHKKKYQSEYDLWESSHFSAIDQDKALDKKISDTFAFCNKLTRDFVKENILLGITQYGMTSRVRQVTQEVEDCLLSASLIDAMSAIRRIPNESKDSRFITNTRMLAMLNKIESFLGMPLSPTL